VNRQARRNDAAGSPWLLRFVEHPDASANLVCIPWAGGGAAAFRSWTRSLPANVQMLAVQPPGRGPRAAEPPLRSVFELARSLAAVLEPFRDTPLVLFGHSLGGLVAFELARELRRGGVVPALLAVAGVQAPHHHYLGPPTHGLPDRLLLEKLRRWGGTPVELADDQDLMDLVLPPLRADLEAYETYVHHPEPPLEIPITAFSAHDDRRADPEKIRAWKEQTCADFRFYDFDGGHFFVQTRAIEFLSRLGDELGRVLAPMASRTS
jgi:surfactin synthase thioesterase subunit